MLNNNDIGVYRSYIITMLLNIVKLIERSTYTFYHSDRVASVSYLIGKEYGIPKRELSVLWRAALLHDIGKIGVDNDIIMKKGKLTDEEYEEIKNHPQYGYDILKPIPFFIVERYIIKHHHERWDGSGYPDGLGGKDIHLFDRILSVADVLDSMVSNRPYRNSVGFFKACEEIIDLSGKCFDPDVVDIFKKLIDNNSILDKYKYFSFSMKGLSGDWVFAE